MTITLYLASREIVCRSINPLITVQRNIYGDSIESVMKSDIAIIDLLQILDILRRNFSILAALLLIV